jgi:hypothetical protein
MDVRKTIEKFDTYLVNQDLSFEAVIVGGAALVLLNVIERATRDCDVLSPQLSDVIATAAKAFAKETQNTSSPLDSDWLNNGPASLTKILPSHWEKRLEVVFTGKALILNSLGRSDILLSKLFALCDRGTDLGDCLALKPTKAELNDSLEWLKYQDANPLWPEHVSDTINNLAERLGYDI